MALFATVLTIAVAGAFADPRMMQGELLQPGVTCYAIEAGGRQIGTTHQTITASQEDGRAVWDIVVHQKAGGGTFDMRDHFVVDRSSLLPLRMESARGRERSEPGWHRTHITYRGDRIVGAKETAGGVVTLDVPLDQPVWDGNLWGVAFAALPLTQGGNYKLPYWQFDKGFGTFTVRIIGADTIETPDGSRPAWIVEAGDRPEALLRYHIAKDPRQELGYSSARGGQRIGGDCR